jgi:4-amino-4-deoxy-L-arabinose transferase-like glycosyltransferase
MFEKLLKSSFLFLIAVTLLAMFLRIVFLYDWIPVFVDEANFLVPGFTLRLTNSLFSISAWQHSGVYQLYSTVFYFSGAPVVALYNARLLFAVVPGVATVVISYFLFKQFYGKQVAMLSSLFLAINPFHVLYSRIAVLYSLSLFMYMLIFFCFLGGFRYKKKSYVLVGFLLLLSIVQISLATIQFCLIFLVIFSILYFLKNRKGLKTFKLKSLLSRYTIIFVVIIAALTILFFAIGTIPFFLQSLQNIPVPEKGFERKFGFNSLDSFSFSTIHILRYLIELNTLPFFILSVIGLIYSIYKKDIFVISWAVAIIPSVIYGYYPRRMLFSEPLIVLLSSIFMLKIIQMIFVSGKKIKNIAVSIKLRKKTLQISTKPILLRVLVIFVILFISLTSFITSYEYSNNLPNSHVASIERDILVSRYTSGYGVLESVNYVKSISGNATILTDTPQQFKFYLTGEQENYSVLDLNNIDLSKEGLLQFISTNDRQVFIIVRWLNWVNERLNNLTLQYPGYPVSLSKIIEIPESSINDHLYVYRTGKYPVWVLNDAQFGSSTQSIDKPTGWRNFTLGWPESLLSYNLTQSADNCIELMAVGDSNWAWTTVGLSQTNSEYTKGNLTYNPDITIKTKLLEQTPTSYLRVQVDFSNGESVRSIIYVYTYLDLNRNNFFKNITNSAYITREVPFESWVSLTINVKNDYESCFDSDYSFGLSSISIGATTCDGNIKFLLQSAELTYNSEPWI